MLDHKHEAVRERVGYDVTPRRAHGLLPPSRAEIDSVHQGSTGLHAQMLRMRAKRGGMLWGVVRFEATRAMLQMLTFRKSVPQSSIYNVNINLPLDNGRDGSTLMHGRKRVVIRHNSIDISLKLRSCRPA